MEKKMFSNGKKQLPKKEAISVAATVLVLVAGCGKGTQSVAGLENFHMNVSQGSLLVTFVADTIHIDAGAQGPIPGIPNSEIGLVPDLQSRGSIFSFSIPLSSLFNQSISGEITEGLPDGRALPGVSTGTLPEWGATVSQTKINIYMDRDTFGFFVPMDFLQNLPAMISQEIDDAKGNLIGKVYAIPTVGSGTESGLLVLVPYVNGQSS